MSDHRPSTSTVVECLILDWKSDQVSKLNAELVENDRRYREKLQEARADLNDLIAYQETKTAIILKLCEIARGLNDDA